MKYRIATIKLLLASEPERQATTHEHWRTNKPITVVRDGFGRFADTGSAPSDSGDARVNSVLARAFAPLEFLGVGEILGQLNRSELAQFRKSAFDDTSQVEALGQEIEEKDTRKGWFFGINLWKQIRNSPPAQFLSDLNQKAVDALTSLSPGIHFGAGAIAALSISAAIGAAIGLTIPATIILGNAAILGVSPAAITFTGVQSFAQFTIASLIGAYETVELYPSVLSLLSQMSVNRLKDDLKNAHESGEISAEEEKDAVSALNSVELAVQASVAKASRMRLKKDDAYKVLGIDPDRVESYQARINRLLDQLRTKQRRLQERGINSPEIQQAIAELGSQFHLFHNLALQLDREIGKMAKTELGSPRRVQTAVASAQKIAELKEEFEAFLEVKRRWEPKLREMDLS